VQDEIGPIVEARLGDVELISSAGVGVGIDLA
jgi:hypothetical protein